MDKNHLENVVLEVEAMVRLNQEQKTWTSPFHLAQNTFGCDQEQAGEVALKVLQRIGDDSSDKI